MASSSRLWLLPASISLYALPINPVHLIVMETQVGLRNHQLIHGSQVSFALSRRLKTLVTFGKVEVHVTS